MSALRPLALTFLLISTFGLLAGCPAPEPSRTSTPPLGPSDAWGELSLEFAARSVSVRVARTPAERQRGLQDVPMLPDDRGMLFTYDDLDVRRFWMKDCRLDLDIVWLGTDGRVLGISEIQAPPPGASDAAIPRAASPGPAAYVLELRRGWCATYGAAVGSIVHGLPSQVSSKGR